MTDKRKEMTDLAIEDAWTRFRRTARYWVPELTPYDFAREIIRLHKEREVSDAHT